MLSDKATELGRLIGQSAEYQAVKRANESLNGEVEITGPLVERKPTPSSLATICASVVLPSPGGP